VREGHYGSKVVKKESFQQYVVQGVGIYDEVSDYDSLVD